MRNLVRQHLSFVPPAIREVSVRIAEVGGVNLGQGKCLLEVPELVKRAAAEALETPDNNRYAPGSGLPQLREAIASKLTSFNKIKTGPENIVVTPGSTGAFSAVCRTFLDEGDEIVNFIPFYPYHHNPLITNKITARYVKLSTPDWSFDKEELASAFNSKTKFIVLCTPHNPVGKVFSREELEFIASLCIEHDCICVTDEVYEYMTYEEKEHISMATIPGMAERTVTMGSYSKTFSITGWRVGYLHAPDSIISQLAAMSDEANVCAPTPFQAAVAKGIKELPDSFYTELKNDYAKKRAFMSEMLQAAGFVTYVPEGAYYMIADIQERFPGKSAEEVSTILIDQAKVGAVPASDFLGAEVKGDPEKSNFLRFCFSVPDDMLARAAENLKKM